MLNNSVKFVKVLCNTSLNFTEKLGKKPDFYIVGLTRTDNRSHCGSTSNVCSCELVKSAAALPSNWSNNWAIKNDRQRA